MAARRMRDDPPNGFAARLRERLSQFGSASALAVAIERSESAVRKWLRGQSEPSVTDLRAVCEITGTSVEWLVTGRGAADDTAVLRDPGAPYGRDAAPLDLALLEKVVDAVESELHTSAIELAPFKHATLIAAGYDLARESGGPDPEAIARLVKLAG